MFMKRMFFVIFITINLSASEWIIMDNVYFTPAESKSSNIFGFRVLDDKNGTRCNLEIMYLTFNTMNLDIKKYVNEMVNISFIVDDKINFKIKTSFDVTILPEYHVAIATFANFIFDTQTMKLFENSNKVKITIDPDQEIAKYFDITSETFNMEHMKEKRKKLVKKECDVEF